MPSKVLVGNLPPGTTEEEVIAFFAAAGADVEVLKIADEGNPDRVTATVVLNVPQTTAQLMADRAKRTLFKDRELEFYVPRFFR
jgi:RNA recognition motif-containing protein